MSKKLVIVESPSKAKTIGGYLGSDYHVMASMGHVMELPSRQGSVDIANDFKLLYNVKSGAKQNVDSILKYAKNVSAVYLATDPDREGEAIASNIVKLLIDKKVAREDAVHRVSFGEITKTAVLNAMKNPRSIDNNIVDAQQARQTLDYLVGFNLSPVLWKKLPGSKSAGRVQSVALRIIVERELEIKAFISHPYYTITADLLHKNECIQANVTTYKKKGFNNNYPTEQKECDEIVEYLKSCSHLTVSNVEVKDIVHKPPLPFITSSLQQEASRKLGFTSKKTMQLAQQLYEGVSIDSHTTGLITYMRTDGIHMSASAIQQIREYIGTSLGTQYLPDKPNVYKSKVKNAQEAHEAIRPTDVSMHPLKMKKYLNKDLAMLYDLIWTRSVACQMKPAIKSRTSISVVDENELVEARISATVLKFDGFIKLYKNSDESEQEEGNGANIIADLKVKDKLLIQSIDPKQHHTIPPSRHTEVSLIKKMEELGIGRPSTYASTIAVIQARGYVKLEKRSFVAENMGIAVVTFLKAFFKQYVEYDFTAQLETDLDLISDAKLDKLSFLKKFWSDFIDNITQVSHVSIQDISSSICDLLSSYLFTKDNEGNLMDKCSLCSSKMRLIFSKHDVVLGCSGYPNCSNIQQIGHTQSQDTEKPTISTSDGNIVEVKTGKYGAYLKITSTSGETKNLAIPKDLDLSNNDEMIKYASLPRLLGLNEENGHPVTAEFGMYGAYVKCNSIYQSIKKDLLFTIDLHEAIRLINVKAAQSHTMIHPTTKKTITVGRGRYGVYARYDKKYYNLKDKSDIADVSLEDALNVIKA